MSIGRGALTGVADRAILPEKRQYFMTESYEGSMQLDHRCGVLYTHEKVALPT